MIQLYIYIHIYLFIFKASQVALAVRTCPPVQEMSETWVRSLGQEDPLEEGMAAHSSIPAWRIPWTEEPDKLQSMVLQSQDGARVRMHTHTHPLPPTSQFLLN